MRKQQISQMSKKPQAKTTSLRCKRQKLHHLNPPSSDESEEMTPAVAEAVASSSAPASTPPSDVDKPPFHQNQYGVQPTKPIALRDIQGLFRDFEGRRDGVLKALTTVLEFRGIANYPFKIPLVSEIFEIYDITPSGVFAVSIRESTEFKSFYGRCDPEKDSLCLYGLPDGTWEVKCPETEVPSDMPKPTVGINLIRNDIDIHEWLTYVAKKSEMWLRARISYLLAQSTLDQTSRMELLNMINDFPKIDEVVTGGAAKKSTNERTSDQNSKSKRSASQPSSSGESPAKRVREE